MKRNPVPASKALKIKQATELYKDFTGHDAGHMDSIKIKPVDVALKFGDCDFIGYTTIRDGVTESYIHRFKKKARPLLLSSYDGKQLILVGNGYTFTNRGIVDK